MQLLLPMLRRRRSRGLFCCWFVSIPPFLASTTTTLATASSSLALFTTPPPPPPPLQQQRLLLMFSGHFPIDLIQKINRLPFGRTRTCNPPLRPFSGSTTTATANDPRQRQRKWFQANTGSFETDTDADEDAEQHSHPHPHQQHYVFGYGSLICPASRSITNPTLSTAAALPVAIRGLQRAWSARTPSGYTAVGVVPTTGSTLHHQQPTEAADDDKSKVNGDYSDSGYCTGVLLRVPTAQALDDLDRREAAYHRRPMCV